MSKLVVKPFQKQEVLNTKLTTIAILNQVILEKFDEIADNKEVWNQRFKNIGKQNISMIEDLQQKVYNQHYEANQNQFIYAEESTRRLVNLLSTLNIDEYIDLMGFVELMKHDKINNTKHCVNFLIENTERINNQLDLEAV